MKENVLPENNATVHHIDGCAHKITFNSPFELKTGENRSIELKQKFFMAAYTDVMPNW